MPIKTVRYLTCDHCHRRGVPPGAAGFRPWFGGVVPPYWSREHFVEHCQPC